MAERYNLRMGQNPSERVLRTVWTIPNVISVLRLLILLPLTVVFLLQNWYLWALISLAALGLTDWLDGFLARSLGQISEFGKTLDPIADRLSVVVVVGALSVLRIVPWQFVATILSVDVILSIATVIWFRGVPGIEVSMVGKVRTAVVLFALPTLILGQATGWHWIDTTGLVLLLIGTAGHIIAGIGYLAAMYKVRLTGPNANTTKRVAQAE